MRNKIIIVFIFLIVSAAILAILLTFFPSSKKSPVKFYYDYTVLDNKKVDSILDIVFQEVNAISENLTLNKRYTRYSSQPINAQHAQSFLKTRNIKYSDTAHIYIGKEISIPAYMNKNREDYIVLSDDDYENSVIVLHELNHRLVSHDYLKHVSKRVAGIKPDYETVDGPACLNLMVEFNNSPFGFLLTQEQVNLINAVDTQQLTIHAHPEDLIKIDIENKVDCCHKGPQDLDRETVESSTGPISDSYYQHLKKTIMELNVSQICVLEVAIKDSIFISEAITGIAFTPFIEGNPDLQPMLVIDTPLMVTPMTVMKDIYTIYYDHMLRDEQLAELFNEEADYFTNVLGIDGNRLTSVRKKAYIRKRLERLSEFLALNHDPIPSVVPVTPLEPPGLHDPGLF